MPDNRYETAPALPTQRPPTRAECWNHYHHYFQGLKPYDQIVKFAKTQWAWFYVRWVNIHGWDKPPDWTEGTEYDTSFRVPVVLESGTGYTEVTSLMKEAQEWKERTGT